MSRVTNEFERIHIANLAKYAKLIEAIYNSATKEAAALAAIVPNYDPDKMFSFSDYPMTRDRLQKLLTELANGTKTVIVNGIDSEWTLANDKNNELARMVFGDNIGKLSQSQYRQYFSTNDAARKAFIGRKEKGLSLSDRVWRYTDMFKDDIELGIDLGLRGGLSADEMSRELRQYLQHPDMLFRRVRNERGELVLSQRARNYHTGQGVYRSSYMNARRLAVTETNIAYRTSDYERVQQFDFVVGIEVCLSNNHNCKGFPTGAFSDICDELAGRYPKTFKFVGWHPHCRCHVKTVLKTPKELMEENRAILRGEEPSKSSANSVTNVPAAFGEWVERNKERLENAQSLPYFVRDNKSVVDEILVPTQKTLTPLEIAAQRHAARTAEEAEAIREAWEERQERIALQNSPIIDWLNKRVANNKDLYAKDLGVIANKMSTEEHVKQLAGGDLTKGSCSSLAYAYAGRMFGLDVLDFRGGESKRFFAESGHIAQITKEAGGKIVKHKNDFVASHQLFNDVVEGKQYYFATARHAAIIRRTSQGIQYLELQSPMPQYNGFFPLDDRVLRYRFGAKKAHTFHGMRFESESYLVDIDNFKDKAWFKEMLRYINTDANKQMKSAAGSIK